MKYVLDASAALRAVLPGPLAPKAIRLQDDYIRKIHDLLAPDIFPAEVASALTKAERQKLIPVGDAPKHYADLAWRWPSFQSYLPLTSRGMEISSQTRSGFYDCLYADNADM